MFITSPDCRSKLSGLFNVYEVNIAFPILLVNRKTDINIEKPILFYFYVLIDKRKPITGMGWMES